MPLLRTHTSFSGRTSKDIARKFWLNRWRGEPDAKNWPRSLSGSFFASTTRCRRPRGNRCRLFRRRRSGANSKQKAPA
jgi:hypothetical protein